MAEKDKVSSANYCVRPPSDPSREEKSIKFELTTFLFNVQINRLIRLKNIAYKPFLEGIVEIELIRMNKGNGVFGPAKKEEYINIINRETKKRISKDIYLKTTKVLLPIKASNFTKIFKEYIDTPKEKELIKKLDEFYLTNSTGIAIGNTELDFNFIPSIEFNYSVLRKFVNIYLYFFTLTIPILEYSVKILYKGYEIKVSFVGEAKILIGFKDNLFKRFVDVGIRKGYIDDYTGQNLKVSWWDLARLRFGTVVGTAEGLLTGLSLVGGLLILGTAMALMVAEAHTVGEKKAKLLAYSRAYIARFLYGRNFTFRKGEKLTKKSEVYQQFLNDKNLPDILDPKFEKEQLQALNDANEISLKLISTEDLVILEQRVLPIIKFVSEYFNKGYFENIKKNNDNTKLVWKNFYLGYTDYLFLTLD